MTDVTEESLYLFENVLVTSKLYDSIDNRVAYFLPQLSLPGIERLMRQKSFVVCDT